MPLVIRTPPSQASASSSSTSLTFSVNRASAPAMRGAPVARHFTYTTRSGSTIRSVATRRSARFRALPLVAPTTTRSFSALSARIST